MERRNVVPWTFARKFLCAAGAPCREHEPFAGGLCRNMATHLGPCVRIEAAKALLVEELEPAILVVNQPERYKFADDSVGELS